MDNKFLKLITDKEGVVIIEKVKKIISKDILANNRDKNVAIADFLNDFDLSEEFIAKNFKLLAATDTIFYNYNMTSEIIFENIDIITSKCIKDKNLNFLFEIVNMYDCSTEDFEKMLGNILPFKNELVFKHDEHIHKQLEIFMNQHIEKVSIKFIEEHLDIYDIWLVILNHIDVDAKFIKKHADLINCDTVFGTNEFAPGVIKELCKALVKSEKCTDTEQKK
jgi:hypothetical protein